MTTAAAAEERAWCSCRVLSVGDHLEAWVNGQSGRLDATPRAHFRAEPPKQAGARFGLQDPYCSSQLMLQLIIHPSVPSPIPSPPSMNSPPEIETARWFSQEVQPHEASLRGYLRHSLRAPAEVDDLMQECYARLLRARSKTGVRSIRGFLFTVARNAVRDVMRRRAVAVTIVVRDLAEYAVLDESSDVVATVSRDEELALLAEAIHALPPRCRDVFLLRKLQGHSQREIALRLGITENTVETLVARGARRCAEHMRQRGVLPISAQ